MKTIAAPADTGLIKMLESAAAAEAKLMLEQKSVQIAVQK